MMASSNNLSGIVHELLKGGANPDIKSKVYRYNYHEISDRDSLKSRQPSSLQQTNSAP